MLTPSTQLRRAVDEGGGCRPGDVVTSWQLLSGVLLAGLNNRIARWPGGGARRYSPAMKTPRRRLPVALALLLLPLCVAHAPPAAAQWVPDVFQCSDAPEGLAGYVGQSTCIWEEQPGVAAFRAELLDAFPVTTDLGIKRACGSGGKSEHKEGRAWDWGVKSWVSSQKAIGDGVVAALIDTDDCGQEHALARRLGIMYMIWNEHVWRAYKPWLGWQPYTGSNPHTDHVHFSFSWPGALQETSYWTDGEAAPPGEEEQPVCVPAPVAGAESSYFKDMVPGSLGFDAALLLAQAGITNGCSNEPKLFCPECPTSRYQAVVFLLRAMGIDIPGPPATPSFDDVPVDVWWLPYVEYAKTLGITSGCGGSNFCPHDPVTRGQMAKFVVKSAGWANVNPAAATFADVPTGHLFYKDIETLKAKCVTNGCGDGVNYCPDELVPRRHAAMFIARAFDLGDYNACIDYCDPSTCAEGGWCDAWSACGGFTDACDETGTRTRTCHDFGSCESSSLDPTCGASSTQESGACERDTDGDVVAGWSVWTACAASLGSNGGAGDPCDTNGTQTRSRTVCSGGGSVTETETQSCTLEVNCPEPDPDPDPEPTPDPDPEPTPDPDPEPKPDPDPEPTPYPDPEPGPEASNAADAGGRSDSELAPPVDASGPVPDGSPVTADPVAAADSTAASSDGGAATITDGGVILAPDVGSTTTVSSTDTSRSASGCTSGVGGAPGGLALLMLVLLARARRRWWLRLGLWRSRA